MHMQTSHPMTAWHLESAYKSSFVRRVGWLPLDSRKNKHFYKLAETAHSGVSRKRLVERYLLGQGRRSGLPSKSLMKWTYTFVNHRMVKCKVWHKGPAGLAQKGPQDGTCLQPPGPQGVTSS